MKLSELFYTIWLVGSLEWIGSGVFGFDLERGVRVIRMIDIYWNGVTEAGRHDFTHFATVHRRPGT
jgi:hypothetical protein